MKKLLTLTLSTLMVLAFSAVSFAGTASLDYYTGQLSGVSGDIDQTSYIFGLDLPFDPFKVYVEYGSGELDSGAGYTWYILKGGWAFINDDNTKLYATLSFFNAEGEIGWDAGATFVGLDLAYNFTDQALLDVGVDYSVAGDFSGADLNMLIWKLKFTYFFNESFGVAAGYRSYGFTYFDDSSDAWVGYSLGVSFKF